MTGPASRSLASARRLSRRAGVLALSSLIHVALGLLLAYLQPEPPPATPVPFTIVDVLVEPPPTIPASPEDPPLPTEAPQPAPAPAPMPALVRAAKVQPPSLPAPPPGPPDYGVELGNDAPDSPGEGPVRTASRARTPTRTRALAPAAGECAEKEVKPRPLTPLQPQYTDAARAAGVQGKVRIQVDVDAGGVVREARVVSPLDPGLDAAALTAVRTARFSPATRCGAPVATIFTVAITFSQ